MSYFGEAVTGLEFCQHSLHPQGYIVSRDALTGQSATPYVDHQDVNPTGHLSSRSPSGHNKELGSKRTFHFYQDRIIQR